MRKILSIILAGAVIIACLIAVARPQNGLETVLYTVKANDTLWKIASEYKKPNTDVRRLIYNIRQINGIGADIQPGQTIIVPLSN